MSKPTVRIAVMGVTGSGKSTFIKHATGSEKVGIGHKLYSYTAEVEFFEFEYGGYKIALLDTPGFNDTTRSETEVLKSIADYLDITFRNPPHLKLTGIIYLQSIMEPRATGSSLRNLKMFRDLVGHEPLKNVILATTRWKMAAEVEPLLSTERETDLQESEDFWKPFLDSGSRYARFEDSRESALKLIMSLVEKQPQVLQIQKELVVEDKNLIDTTAGNTVNEESKRLEEKYKAEIASIQKDMDDALAARDKDLQEALAKSEESFQRKLDRVHKQQDMLRYEQRDEARRSRDEQEQLAALLASREEEMKKQKLGYEEALARIKANESKLRREQQEAIDAKLQEMDKKDKKDKTAWQVVLGLFPLVGMAIFALLGIPAPVGP